MCGVRETKEERRRGVIEFPLYSPARSAAHGTINGRNGDKKTQQKKHDAPVIEKKGTPFDGRRFFSKFGNIVRFTAHFHGSIDGVNAG